MEIPRTAVDLDNGREGAGAIRPEDASKERSFVLPPVLNVLYVHDECYWPLTSDAKVVELVLSQPS